MNYISGLEDLIELKKQHPEYRMILHSDQGSVYASKAYNELLPMYGITRSMSRAGTPTDNAAMESINGWIKSPPSSRKQRKAACMKCICWRSPQACVGANCWD